MNAQAVGCLKLPRTRQAGMTLIELMIVVVIVGILASVAVPSYLEYTRRAKRSEAKALLADITARLERYYFDNSTYTVTLTDLGYASAAPKSAESHYVGSVVQGASNDIKTSYIAQATPTGGHADTKCDRLTLDSRGTKGSSVSANTEECWR